MANTTRFRTVVPVRGKSPLQLQWSGSLKTLSQIIEEVSGFAVPWAISIELSAADLRKCPKRGSRFGKGEERVASSLPTSLNTIPVFNSLRS